MTSQNLKWYFLDFVYIGRESTATKNDSIVTHEKLFVAYLPDFVRLLGIII